MLAGIAITNKFAMEEGVPLEEFSPADFYVPLEFLPHWQVFSFDLFASGKEVHLEVHQGGCTPPLRSKLRGDTVISEESSHLFAL
jgi:hypothetical protein